MKRENTCVFFKNFTIVIPKFGLYFHLIWDITNIYSEEYEKPLYIWLMMIFWFCNYIYNILGNVDQDWYSVVFGPPISIPRILVNELNATSEQMPKGSNAEILI